MKGRTHSLSPFYFSLIVIVVFCCCSKHEARNSISVGDPLIESLVSAGSKFELGIFTPEGNAKGNRYLGIWYYKLLPRTVVWIARRDTPLHDFCRGIKIGEDGNIVVGCGNGAIKITSLESSGSSNRTLQLCDSGNLVLADGKSGTKVWQSFEKPSDTFLPGMKMTDKLKLVSWISPSDPAFGNYTFEQVEEVYILKNRSVFYWKSDEADLFVKQNLVPTIVYEMLSNFSSSQNHKPVTPLPNYYNSRIVMNSSGQISLYSLSDSGSWELFWSAPEGPCSAYRRCGRFGICSENNKSIMCQCAPGYRPASLEDWNAGVYSGGCDRDSTCSQNQIFINLLLKNVGGEWSLYDHADSSNATEEYRKEVCEKECLNDCHCVAYSFGYGRLRGPQQACFMWTSDLVFYGNGTKDGVNLSLRITDSPPPPSAGGANQNKDLKASKIKKDSQRIYMIAITALLAGIILLSCSGVILYRRRTTTVETQGYQRRSEASSVFFSAESERHVNNLMQENDKKIDVPFYNLDLVLSATDNFSYSNKLGQGGFGPVYKGRFPEGSEIAVKRLSSCSGQGIGEFLNEVVLIAKLQHRNLVRLLGYCIEGSEKILIYEYMPNRSLDAFLFDEQNQSLLNWKKRFDIILGIARGLLYLHEDSRLRIIHRDLKTSNILLDEDMNPKISDFGLARIVEGKGTEASTNKVVGTYGYMSPEYALDGKFSTKSDVFSFGVVMLEIVSGRKNTGFYNPQQVINLLGYTWRLWCNNKALDVMDPTLLESCDKSEVIKCINIGLLCVQEDPIERPSMSTVVIMLGSKTGSLPLPTQPAFVVRRRLSTTSSSSSSSKPDTNSLNELTTSMLQGR